MDSETVVGLITMASTEIGPDLDPSCGFLASFLSSQANKANNRERARLNFFILTKIS
jgi:hypothetical protein